MKFALVHLLVTKVVLFSNYLAMSFGIYSFDVIYDVIASMQTLKYGTPKASYPNVSIDTFICFLWSLCKIIWMNIQYFQMPLVIVFLWYSISHFDVERWLFLNSNMTWLFSPIKSKDTNPSILDDNRTHHRKAWLTAVAVVTSENRRSENRFCRLFSSPLSHH